jgi:hypothetical protein
MDIALQCTSSEKQVTVGQVWSLDCDQGREKTTDSKLDRDPYQIVVLDQKVLGDGRHNFKVTSYRVGKHPMASLQQGSKEWALPEFEVISVLEKEDKGFGPLIVEGMSLPKIYLIVPVVFIFILGAVLALAWWRRKKQKDQLTLMGIGASHSPAHMEFYARSRQLFRQVNLSEGIGDLKKFLLFYIARKELIPTYYWSDKKIFQFLKKKRIPKKLIDRLEFLLHEISDLDKKQNQNDSDKKGVLRQDFENILRWSTDFVENYEKETSRDIS